MAVTSVNSVVEVIRGYKLLDPSQLDELTHLLQPKFPTSQALAKELLQRGWLTAYQANQILQGRAKNLAVGPYIVLERLGEGAMGEVLKGRHPAMNRLVALKLLRKDLLTDKDMVGRFYREIEVLSHLSHPNIVHAYDADVVGDVHYLAMEYVEGVDLAQLIKEKGPLPVAQACDYIRQAALGLQHAHEKGLVHRDIKPSNLLVSKNAARKSKMKTASSIEIDLAAAGSEYGLLKILDLGLARLQEPSATSKTRNLTVLAGNQVMQGTPDYMAPEQALDFHRADIRADIYSLGCTFYFLLAGRAPFEGASLHEKLLKHQTVNPAPIAMQRPGVPSGLQPIFDKMLAKRPTDRYQTPGEIAQALTKLLSVIVSGGATPPPNKNIDKQSVVKKRGSTLRLHKDASDSTLQGDVVMPAAPPPPPGTRIVKRPTVLRTPEQQRIRKLLRAGGIGLGVVVLISAVGLMFTGGDDPHAAATPASGSKPLIAARTAPLTTEASRTMPATLVIQCGKGQGKNQDQLKAPGYDYKVIQASNHDGWANAVKSHCWHHEKDLKFEVYVPKGTGGLLRLWFVDGDRLGRKQKVFINGKQFGGLYEAFDVALQAEIPISAAEAESGKIEVSLQNAAGKHNAVVSAIEFMPYVRR